MISIDFDVNPAQIVKDIDIPVQGGLDPKILLTDKKNLKKKTLEYLNIFKDHPYVFNLGHGILPNTEISMVEELIKLVRNLNDSRSPKVNYGKTGVLIINLGTQTQRVGLI